MKSYLKFILIGQFIFSNWAFANNWQSYFPTNKVLKSNVMELSTTKEVIGISKKLQKGIAEHQEWFKNYVREVKPGSPMPYHPNMGITKEEYDQLLRPKTMQLKNIGMVDVTFHLEQNKTIIIKTTPASPINGLVVSENEVTTPYGKAKEIKQVNNMDRNSATGPWQGIQWSYTDFDEKAMAKKSLDEYKGTMVRFAVGRLANGNEGIIYYDVKDVDAPNKKKNIYSYIIYFPLK